MRRLCLFPRLCLRANLEFGMSYEDMTPLSSPIVEVRSLGWSTQRHLVSVPTTTILSRK